MSSKKRKSEIREKLRNDMNNQFKRKYVSLCNDVDKWKGLYNEVLVRNKELSKRVVSLSYENEELTDKLRMYEEWSRRLLEFVDISDDVERREAFKAYIEGQQNSNRLKGLLDSYSRIFRFL